MRCRLHDRGERRPTDMMCNAGARKHFFPNDEELTRSTCSARAYTRGRSEVHRWRLASCGEIVRPERGSLGEYLAPSATAVGLGQGPFANELVPARATLRPSRCAGMCPRVETVVSSSRAAGAHHDRQTEWF